MKLFDNKKYVSIDLGSREIKVIEGKATKKNINIQNAHIVKIPNDIYFNGMINNMDQLSYYLKTSLKDNKIKANDAILVINSSNIIIREIILPKVSDEQIKSILSYQVEDYIPIEPEDYVFQYLHLGSVFEDGVEKLNISLIAIPKTIVESHLQLLDNIGLKPHVLDFQGNAINKLFNYNNMFNDSYTSNGKTVVSVDMGYSSTKINITLDGVLKVSRVISASLSQIIVEIQSLLEIHEDDIMNRIKNLDLNNDEIPNSIEDSTIISSLNNTLSLILDGVGMVINYYNTRDMGNRVDYILLQGGLSKINGIEDRFSTFFNTSTFKLNSFDRIRTNVNMGEYSNAIGCLIRSNEV
ncbi:MAG: pilus assembly protein PilM [Tissierellaceae bacterium]|nr:pilus assembly protein PilM [Tissierellaceae bacterium]